jgi:hypothetical protein
MHPLQYIFIAMMLCVLAYLVLSVMGWVLRRFTHRYAVLSVSSDDAPDYVEIPVPHTLHAYRVSTGGKAEEEKQAEAEARPETPRAPSLADINALLANTREEATARALGVLLGSGLIVPEGRSRAMVALFGPAGRKHTRVRPWIDTAEASASAARAADAPPEDVRLVTLDAGGPNERKMVL